MEVTLKKSFYYFPLLIENQKNILQSESAGESVVTGWKRYIKKDTLVQI